MDRQRARQEIANIAAEVSLQFTHSTTPADQVHALNRLVFERQKMRASSDTHDACNLLPSAVLQRRQGYCVGLAALYLAVSENLHLPVYAVATPSHLFLRYDDGTTRINIETTAMGLARTNESYIDEGRIPDYSLRKRIFLRELTSYEFLAQVHNNIGVVYSEKKDYLTAEREYQVALDLDRRLPAAWYNWGNDRLNSDDFRQAVKLFTRSLDLYPTDVWALSNRGLAYGNLGKIGKARRDFEQALRLEPGFGAARRNLNNLGDGPEVP
jgi:regulator of sirC expression with transglutaminase-like and TPR domain